MTNSNTPQVPAGWYPDPAGTPRTRWWDGAAWTEHYADSVQQPTEALSPTQQAAAAGTPLYQAQYQPAYAPSQVLRAPEGTNPYTPFAWAFVGVLVLPIIGFALFDFTGYMLSSIDTSADPSFILLTPSYLLLLATGWIYYLASALFAFLDYRALKKAGVPKPFHWAWTFLSAIIYPIGRSVIVKRRTGSGMNVLWAYLALYIIYFAIVLIKTVIAISALLEAVPFSSY